eukprot:XP_001689606.1 metal ion transporter [Chlamydomonas reinhardtii]
MLSRSGTLTTGKSFGDLRALQVVQGRSRAKKSRAMKWLVLRASGERQIFTLDKRQLNQTCKLEIPIRDMKLMDSALGTETLAQLLVRDNALVFAMEHVRIIIMHDKVVVPLDESGPPPPPAPAPSAATVAAASSSQELKDRFIAHMEGVVMDWALQHGATLADIDTVTCTGAGGGGGGAYGGAAGSGVGGGGSVAGLGSPMASTGGAGAGAGSERHAHSSAFHVGFGATGGSGHPAAPSANNTGHGGNTIAAHLEAHGGAGGGSGRAGSARTPTGGGSAPAAGAGAGAGTGAAGGCAPSGLTSSGLAAHQAAGGGSLGGGMGAQGGMADTASQTAFDPEYQPFEMLVLETALSEICTHLSRDTDVLQLHCQPALEALMKTADTANLEAVRRVKTQHSRLVTQDDDDMVRMCLTQQVRMRLAAVTAAAQAQVQQMQAAAAAAQAAQAAAAAGTPGGVPPALTSIGSHSGHGPSHHNSAGAAVPILVPHSPGSPPGAHSPPHLDPAQQLAMINLMGSSISTSYMRPASLAARAMRHSVAKGKGALGEALAEAAAAAAAAAAAQAAAAQMAQAAAMERASSAGTPLGLGHSGGSSSSAAAAMTPGAAPMAGGSGMAGGAPGAGGMSASDLQPEPHEHDFLDVENLLESYMIIVDTTYQTLMSIGEYIDDTEDLINIQLDYSRNKLIRFDILITTGTFAAAFFNMMTGMLGENLVLPDTITQDIRGFIIINVGTLCFCFATFFTLVAVFKWNRVL